MAPHGAPLQLGVIDSLARPGGNVTGLSGMDAEIGGKLRPEAFKGNEGPQCHERIALSTDRLKALVEIVEPQLPHGIPPREPKSARRNESDLLTPRQCYFSRSPSLPASVRSPRTRASTLR